MNNQKKLELEQELFEAITALPEDRPAAQALSCKLVALDYINELEELIQKMKLQAQIWAGEAKTQRNTVNKVGSLLGGVPDWGPIVKGVDNKLQELQTYKDFIKWYSGMTQGKINTAYQRFLKEIK